MSNPSTFCRSSNATPAVAAAPAVRPEKVNGSGGRGQAETESDRLPPSPARPSPAQFYPVQPSQTLPSPAQPPATVGATLRRSSVSRPAELPARPLSGSATGAADRPYLASEAAVTRLGARSARLAAATAAATRTAAARQRPSAAPVAQRQSPAHRQPPGVGIGAGCGRLLMISELVRVGLAAPGWGW